MGLKNKYQQMFNLTNLKCGECRVPYSCCSDEDCASTQDFAKELRGVDISHLNTANKIRFLGENGCVVEPYLRPICTVHVCENHYMTDIGFNEQYFDLREEINLLEMDDQSKRVK